MPWLGYFSKLHYADNFVLLDDAYFTKGHYIDRARIINMHGEAAWINIPVGQNYNKPIIDVAIYDKKYIGNIISTISHSYKKSRYYKETMGIIFEIEKKLYQEDNLAEINQKIIGIINRELQIRVNIDFSSRYNFLSNNITDKIISYCDIFSDNELLVGDGNGMETLDVMRLKENGISIFRQSYFKNHPLYFQVLRQHLGFEKGLSIIDAIFNIGIEETIQLLNSVKIENY